MHGPHTFWFPPGKTEQDICFKTGRGPWLAAIEKMDGRGGRRRRKGESFVQIILLPVKKGFQQKAGMPRVGRVRPCSAVILAQVCW